MQQAAFIHGEMTLHEARKRELTAGLLPATRHDNLADVMHKR